MPDHAETFDFRPGRKVGQRYIIERRLGGGSEGEVYRVREVDTGIHRAAKFYYPDRDPRRKRATRHAQKLNLLRHCAIVLQYHHSEIITVRKRKVVAMVSDLFEGEPLEQWVHRHRGKKLPAYVALHLFYNLVRGLEAIHLLGQYHADVHSQNIMIQPSGVRFELKLIDFFDWGKPTRGKQKQDIRDAVAVFHEILGGREHYASQPAWVKTICCGMRRDRILARFPSITALRHHLESFEWDDGA